MKVLISLILLIICCVGSVFAQKKDEKPNFSGTWKLDIEKSIFNEHFSKLFKENKSRVCSSELKINHREPKLSINNSFYCYQKDQLQRDSDNYVSTFYTDARGEKNSIDIAIFSSRTHWIGTKIVTINRLDESQKDEYHLSENGKVLIIKKTYGRETKIADQNLVYYLSKN